MSSATSPPLPVKQKYFDPQDENQYPFGFDQPVQVSGRMKRPIELFKYWAAVAYDPTTRRFVSRVSPSLNHDKTEIVGHIAPKFQSYIENLLKNDSVDHEPNDRCEIIQQPGQDQFALSKGHRGKKAFQHSHRSRKKQRLSNTQKVEERDDWQDANTKENAEQSTDDSERKILSYRIDARDDWEQWLAEAFRAVQQVSCRVIAKEWIKTIHPKKQSTNPYNGKVSGSRDRGNPQLTKPPYWPPDVIHKEPDHINKEQRTKLLVHLLMGTPHQEVSLSGDSTFEKEINALMLKESLDKKSDELRAKWPIIEHIIYIRTRLEMFEEGGLDGGTVFHVPNYSEASRNNGTKADDSLDETKDDGDPTRTSDAEFAMTKDHGTMNLKQEQEISSCPPIQDTIPTRKSSNHRREATGDIPQNFQGFALNRNNEPPSRSPQEIQTRECDTEIGEQVMDVDNTSFEHGQNASKNRNDPRSSTQLYHSRDFAADLYNMQPFQHWHHQSLNLHSSYTQDNMMTQNPMEISEQDGMLEHMYASTMGQPMYYGTPMYGHYEQNVQGQNRSVHKSLSNQYENYMPQDPHGRVVMHQQYLPNVNVEASGLNDHQHIDREVNRFI